MASRSEERFDREEVGELIGLASMLEAAQGDGPETGLTYDQLRRVAEEFGISERALRQVIRDRDRGFRAGMKQAKRRVTRRLRFIRHLTAYLVVVGALFLVDWLNGGGWWFYYVGHSSRPPRPALLHAQAGAVGALPASAAGPRLGCKIADLVVVDGDPFDFATLKDRVEQVWKDGMLVVDNAAG
jgi:hypothetical protein